MSTANLMKNLSSILILLFSISFSYAQTQNLRKAKNSLKKKDYTTAIKLASQAATNADTKDNPDVYLILGQSNMYLFEGSSNNISLAQQSLDNFRTAIEKGGETMKEGLMKEVVMNAKNERLTGGDIMYLQNLLTRQANAHFEAQEYDKSYDHFLMANEIVPNDIVLNFYTGYSAYAESNNEVAVEKYQKVIALNEALPSDEKYANARFAFNGLIDIYFTKQLDYDKALKYIKIAKATYPDEQIYKDYEVDVYIKSDRMEEAIQGLRDRVNSGDATKQTYYMMGYLYMNNDNLEEAKKAADQALSLDPGYYDALYVAGSVCYNQASELLKTANNTSDDAEYGKLTKDANAKFRAAMPYFEKAIVLLPEDSYSLNPLATIYDRLNMDDKRDEILARLAKLEGN